MILCVAGEASGDALLAPVVRRLRAAGHRCVGLGGDASAAAGLELLGHARTVAAHGLVEAAGTLPALLGVGRRLVARLPEARALLLVDFPELNVRLLRRAPVLGLVCVHACMRAYIQSNHNRHDTSLP